MNENREVQNEVKISKNMWIIPHIFGYFYVAFLSYAHKMCIGKKAVPVP